MVGRLLVVLASASCGLAVASPASAQTLAPRFTVQHSPYELERPVHTSLEVVLPRAGRPTETVVMYAAHGYSATLTARPQTRLGRAAIGFVPEIDPFEGLGLLEGEVLAVDPTRAAQDEGLQRCAPGRHEAVWALTIELLFDVFVVVDATQGDERALGSYRLQLCYGELPVGEPGPPGPSKLVVARFSVDGVFFAPGVPGDYLWRAFAIPARAGPDPPGEPDALELRALVPMPYRMLLRARFEPGRRTALVEGTLTGGGRPLGGVDIWVFRTRTSRSPVTIPARRAPTKTTAKGRFRTRVRHGSTAWVVAVAFPRPRSCREPPSAACLSETMSPRVARPVRVRVPALGAQFQTLTSR
jgi:hypothetical protein